MTASNKPYIKNREQTIKAHNLSKTDLKLKPVLLRLRPVNYFFLNNDKTKTIHILSKYNLLKKRNFS